MAVTTTAQTITVDEVTSLVLTGIEQDPSTGEYVREVRASSNVVGSGDAIVFRLQLRSTTREGIEVATPSLVV